jgi:hypothetical protein
VQTRTANSAGHTGPKSEPPARLAKICDKIG